MKRLTVSIIGLAVLFGASVFAINPSDVPQGQSKPPVPKTSSVKKPVAKPMPRETRMRVTGTVKEVTATLLRIERAVTAEIMEFHLETPVDKIKQGEKVTVSFIQKEEKNIAKRVSKAVSKKKGAAAQAVAAPAKGSPPSSR